MKEWQSKRQAIAKQYDEKTTRICNYTTNKC